MISVRVQSLREEEREGGRGKKKKKGSEEERKSGREGERPEHCDSDDEVASIRSYLCVTFLSEGLQVTQ